MQLPDFHLSLSQKILLGIVSVFIQSLLQSSVKHLESPDRSRELLEFALKEYLSSITRDAEERYLRAADGGQPENRLSENDGV